MIKTFKNEYFFLSNFYPAEFTYNGISFKNSEAAFHAQKCKGTEMKFSQLTPSEAKRMGRHVKLRKDWEQVKDGIMLDIVREKFRQNLHLKQKLLSTGTQELIEGNTWNDTYWGVCNGRGRNQLGKILMKVREEFQNETN